MVGIEPNPGPQASTVPSPTPCFNMGVINARSIVNKSVLIHDIITDNHLDILAVTETWVYDNSSDVHKKEAAPDGFSITHYHRITASGGSEKQNGGGVALIHRENIRVRLIKINPSLTLTFELLIAKIANWSIGLTLAVIYRPPGPKSNPAEFADELSNLIDTH